MSMRIAFLGSSLLSSYWNGAATYYRGIISALHRLGIHTKFYEPDAFDRQQHRDIEPPSWADVVVYPPTIEAMRWVCEDAARADVVVKASGVGVLDDELLATMLVRAGSEKVTIFWDVDAPATLQAMRENARHPLHLALPRLDLVLTYGGGPPVVAAYESFGARRCVAVYNALDPSTHFPAERDPRFLCDLAFLGNRLPDREARVESFFFDAARLLPERLFLLGGAGWESWQLPPNVRHVGHVATPDHNAFNSTPLAVLNIARDSMAHVGFSPATRVFEAAGAAACLISDAWQGIEQFLAPGTEVLLARSGEDVARHISELTPARAREIGQRARSRVLAEHTYDRRATQVAEILAAEIDAKRRRGAA